MGNVQIVKNIAEEYFEAPRARRLSNLCFFAAAVGGVVSCFGLVSNVDQFAFSWLWAFMFAFTIVVGAIFWMILHTATDSEWGVLVRRQMENLGSCFVVFPFLFLPLVGFCAPRLWKWWGVSVGVDPLLDAKRAYLNVPFFCIRATFYFGGLGLVAFLLRRLSVRQDSDGDGKHTIVMRKVAVAGLPLLAVCLTFAAVDWLMGLDYHWFSTMWGVYIFAGAAGSSMAAIVIIVAWLLSKGCLKQVNGEHFHVMGKFLLAFTVFWAYIAYSQYMLIWYANIPEETIYFKIRNTESWHALSVLLVCGRFFLPFPFLLFQSNKKSPRRLVGISVWILLMQLLDLYIVVLPSLHVKGVSPSVYDLSALAAVVGCVAGLFFRRLPQAALFPARDPRLCGSLGLSN
jgi:hypothetical protein